MNNEHEKFGNGDSGNNGSEGSNADRALDAALQQWGDDHTADREHLRELQSRVIENLHAEKHTQTSIDSADPKPQNGQWLTRQKVWLALAAMLMMAIGLFVSRMNQDQAIDSETIATKERSTPEQATNPTEPTTDSNAIAIAQTNLAQQQVLLNGFQEVFGKQIQWVSEIDGNVAVQLNGNDSTTDSASGDSKFVSIRLVLISRDVNSNTNDWKLVRDIRLLTDPERTVELASSQGADSVSVWAFPVDKDLISIDVQYRLLAPFKIDVSTSELQKSGIAEEIFAATNDGVEYRIYQTARRLGESGDNNSEKNGLGELRINELLNIANRSFNPDVAS